MQNDVVMVKKGSRFWKVVGILLAIAGLCAVAVVVYKKFFQKKNEELEETEEPEALDGAEETPAAEEIFEVPAEAVIANVEAAE
ncbi:MAG: hypothetical protein IJX80_04865 [Clostridia bacterium]|nr:hypothetical protein [Clostridia bacterium]